MGARVSSQSGHRSEAASDDAAPASRAQSGDPTVGGVELFPFTTDHVKPPYDWVPPGPKWSRQHPPGAVPLRPSVVVVPQDGATALPREELVARIRGCIVGQAVGDAVGLATEFMLPDQVRRCYGDLRSYLHAQRFVDPHRARFPRGDWTDDTDQMLCILESLVQNGGEVVETDIAYRLVYWMHNGFPELKDVAGLGLGSLMARVLESSVFLDNPTEAARLVWAEMKQRMGRPPRSNGAVMRTAVLGVTCFHDTEAVARRAAQVCVLTHHDPLCVASCVAVCVAVALLLQGRTDTVAVAQDAVQRALTVLEDPADREELSRCLLARDLASLELASRSDMGYTLKTAGAGFWALRAQLPFADVILAIVREGGDADTNAAVAGALVGCALGVDALPQQWVSGMPHLAWLNDRVDRLLAVMGLVDRPDIAAAQVAAESTAQSDVSADATHVLDPAAAAAASGLRVTVRDPSPDELAAVRAAREPEPYGRPPEQLGGGADVAAVSRVESARATAAIVMADAAAVARSAVLPALREAGRDAVLGVAAAAAAAESAASAVEQLVSEVADAPPEVLVAAAAHEAAARAGEVPAEMLLRPSSNTETKESDMVDAVVVQHGGSTVVVPVGAGTP